MAKKDILAGLLDEKKVGNQTKPPAKPSTPKPATGGSTKASMIEGMLD